MQESRKEPPATATRQVEAPRPGRKDRGEPGRRLGLQYLGAFRTVQAATGRELRAELNPLPVVV
ncbi:MAG TPA: hypothetical protein VNZ57_15295 [Longimicrobiales bacterium]|nr:hypothetical protein [Longimicrobiales bacterium]